MQGVMAKGAIIKIVIMMSKIKVLQVEKEIKGGFEIKLAGTSRAFCPYSQFDLRRVQDPAALLGGLAIALLLCDAIVLGTLLGGLGGPSAAAPPPASRSSSPSWPSTSVRSTTCPSATH